MNNSFSIQDLSPHLFWDVDMSKLNYDTSGHTIIYKVLEYGTLHDWDIIKKVYGKDEILKTSLTFRSLDPVTLSFLSQYFQIDKSAFRCYTNKQSPPNFWNT